MIQTQATKKVAIEPLSYSAGAAATYQIDTAAYDYATIDVQLGKVSNASNVPTVIKLGESDNTNTSTFVDIAGSSHTANVTALPTTGVTICTWDVTCIPRKRYLLVTVTPLATELVACIANLSRGEQGVKNATDKNIASWVVL